MIYTYLYNDVTYQVNVELQSDGSYRILIGEREYQVEASALRNGGLKILLNGKNHTVYTAQQGRTRYVKVDGEEAQTLTVPDQRVSKQRGGSGGSGALVAQMPGQVVDVYAGEGDTVTSGQTLVVLEAMKMEIRVSAPYDGRVERVLVKKGDVVEREQLLVEVKRDEG
jgi:3-methylcrotonyl-CoA carboxylase alpha subunit